jgi:hypothetical protein
MKAGHRLDMTVIGTEPADAEIEIIWEPASRHKMTASDSDRIKVAQECAPNKTSGE